MPFLLAPADGWGALWAPCCTPTHSTNPYLAKISCFVVFNMGPLDPSPIQPNPPDPHPHPHSTLPHTILPHPTPLHPMGITFYQFGCVTIDLINLRSFYSPLDALQPNKFMNNFLPYFFSSNGHISAPR